MRMHVVIAMPSLRCWQVFQWLDANCRKTKRSIDEKGGKGTYLRVFHWAEYKDVPPLSSLAEIKTLKDEAGLN